MTLEHQGNKGDDVESHRGCSAIPPAAVLISSVPLAMAVTSFSYALLRFVVLERRAWENKQWASLMSGTHPFEPNDRLPRRIATELEDLGNLVVQEGAVEGAKTLSKRDAPQECWGTFVKMYKRTSKIDTILSNVVEDAAQSHEGQDVSRKRDSPSGASEILSTDPCPNRIR
jgi:hypothetical protein